MDFGTLKKFIMQSYFKWTFPQTTPVMSPNEKTVIVEKTVKGEIALVRAPYYGTLRVIV